MLSLYPVARGERSMAAAVDDGSIRLFGEPDLVEALADVVRGQCRGTAERTGGAAAVA